MATEEQQTIQIPYLSDDDVKKLVWITHMNMQELLKMVQEDKNGIVQSEVQKD